MFQFNRSRNPIIIWKCDIALACAYIHHQYLQDCGGFGEFGEYAADDAHRPPLRGFAAAADAAPGTDRSEMDMGWVHPWVGLGWVAFSGTCDGLRGLG